MRQTPDYTPNFYEFTTPEECVEAIREHREKVAALHEARMEAHSHMTQARAEHEFLVRCTDKAENEMRDLSHRLETLIKRQAYEMTKGVADEV